MSIKSELKRAIDELSEEPSQEQMDKFHELIDEILFPTLGRLELTNTKTDEARVYVGDYEMLRSASEFLEQGLEDLFGAKIVFKENYVTISADGWEAELVKLEKEVL